MPSKRPVKVLTRLVQPRPVCVGINATVVRCIATAGTGSPENRQTTLRSRPSPLALKTLVSKTAIVTGGSRGIGRAIAHHLALEGVSCMLVGRDEATLRKTVDSLPPLSPIMARRAPLAPPQSTGPAAESRVEIEVEADLVCAKEPLTGVATSSEHASEHASEHPSGHRYFTGDVRDNRLWSALFASTPDVHFLINAAGVTQESLLIRTTPAEIKDILDVNLYGTIAGCRTAMRTWLKNRSRDRCIINVSSLMAVCGGYGATVYAASKAGIVGFTHALANEGSGRNIRANVILPGYIHTDMTLNMQPKLLNELRHRIPMGRFGTPDEVADAALFLAKNTYANNCILNLDGGLSAVI